MPPALRSRGSRFAPEGDAILSGIMCEERHEMLEAGRWSVVAEISEEDWWSVLINRS